MSTVQHPLQYLWSAYFTDGQTIHQPSDDRYSKHDPDAEHNPSAFRDFLDKSETVAPLWFKLYRPMSDPIDFIHLRLDNGLFWINGTFFKLHDQNVHPTDLKVIFYREVKQEYINGEAQEPRVTAFYLGYEGRDAVTDKKIKHVLCIPVE